VDVGTGESKSAQPSLVVDAGVQLESVVLALPVVASVGYAPSDPVPPAAYQFADWQHGGVHEAKLCFACKQVAQQPVEQWERTVAVRYEVLVGGQMREVALVVLAHPVVDPAQGLLLHREQVERQNGDYFAVAKGGRTAKLFSCLGCRR